MRGLRGPPCGLPHSLKHRMETTHLGPTGAPSAGVDGLWAICAPSVNFCSFIGHQVAKKRPCTSQSNFRRALGETPALIAHGDHSVPRPWLTGSHLLSLSSPARVPRPPLLRPARNETIRGRAVVTHRSHILIELAGFSRGGLRTSTPGIYEWCLERQMVSQFHFQSMCSWRESNLLQLYQPHGHPYPFGEMNCGCVCCISVVLHWAGNFMMSHVERPSARSTTTPWWHLDRTQTCTWLAMPRIMNSSDRNGK